MNRYGIRTYIVRWICIFVVATLVFGPAAAALGATMNCILVHAIRRHGHDKNTVLKVLFGV